ncbi:MAG: hypothetical protein G01um101429_68 [Parcubacteria group bacterium Gr01-1014_29]|nr:MAG: hypothetical protein G01um101429_68 [Parcubacteria group bacterium Gr01-1014_29]
MVHNIADNFNSLCIFLSDDLVLAALKRVALENNLRVFII